MILHKYETDGRIKYTEIYDDELVTFCGGCNKEIEVTLKDISQIYESKSDFAGTMFYCKSCFK